MSEKEILKQMNERFNQMQDMMVNLISIVGNTNARLEELQQEVRETKDELRETKRELQNEIRDTRNELKQDIQEIKDNQERQDRVLELLAVKSVEAESYIRDFKRFASKS